jgi:hypothetical protein
MTGRAILLRAERGRTKIVRDNLGEIIYLTGEKKHSSDGPPSFFFFRTLAVVYHTADQITVKIPGTVLSPNTPLHPNDGWPLDPLLCIRKLAAQMDKVMRKNSFMISSGRLATYEE